MTARKQLVVTAEASTNDARTDSGDGTSIECFDDEHGASGGARVRLVCGAHELWLWLLFIMVQSWMGMHSLAAGGGHAIRYGMGPLYNFFRRYFNCPGSSVKGLSKYRTSSTVTAVTNHLSDIERAFQFVQRSHARCNTRLLLPRGSTIATRCCTPS